MTAIGADSRFTNIRVEFEVLGTAQDVAIPGFFEILWVQVSVLRRAAYMRRALEEMLFASPDVVALLPEDDAISDGSALVDRPADDRIEIEILDTPQVRLVERQKRPLDRRHSDPHETTSS